MVNKKINGQISFRALNIILLYLVIGIIIILGYPNNSELLLKQNYIIDTIAYFIIAGIFIGVFIKNKMDIFDPIVFITIIYIMMFIIMPIMDIHNGKIIYFGVNLFEYGIKGTIISVIGYISFFVGYMVVLRKKSFYYKKRKKNELYDKNKIIHIAILIWIVCFSISIIYLIFSGGYSLSYILSVGLVGDVNKIAISSNPLGVLSMFSYSLIPTCLIYSTYGKSKFIKLLVFFLTTIIQLIKGFRFIVVILILSYIYMYYLKNKKRPSFKVIFISAIGMILLIGIMEFSRSSIRSGEVINWNSFKWEDISDAVFGNFRIYNTYYAVLKAVPEITPHLYGQQIIIYTLVMFIPRIIWPNKPMPMVNEPIKLGISQYASDAGQAYPGLGEYYYDFGIIGVIFFMWLFGYLMRKLKQKYLHNKEDNLTMITYSILIPTTMQVIIRGYTPSNFYLVIFLILPIIIIKKLIA